MIKELNHIGIRSAHMEESIALYKKALSGRIIRDAQSLDGASRFVYIQIGIGVLELISVKNEADEGFAHVAFLLDGAVDDAYERLKDQVRFTVLPKKAGSGDGRLAFFEDKSGVIFEIIERKENVRMPAFETPLVKAFDHTRLATRAGLDACAAFYTGEMGFSQAPGYRFTHGGDALCLEAGDPGIAYLALETSDISSAHATLSKAYACGDVFALSDGKRAFDLKAPSRETVRFFANA